MGVTTPTTLRHLRNFSLCSAKFLFPTLSCNLGKNVPLFTLPSPSVLKPRFFASNNGSSIDCNRPEPNTANQSQNEDVDDISDSEFKSRIERYYKGDAEALPSIFEAILTRKLSGKHEESDEKLMEDLWEKKPPPVDVSDNEFDSDLDD